jgi:hypothetical protein
MAADMTSREERVAHNEANARAINEGIEAAHRGRSPDDHIRVVCECGDASCEQVIAMTLSEYEAVRSDAHRFAIRRGHEKPDIEDVVYATDRFLVVAKREGTPATIAEEEDPRS